MTGLTQTGGASLGLWGATLLVLLAMALVDGGFICKHHFDAAAALRHILRERITSLYLVPTLYHDLVGHPDFAACDTSSDTKLGFAGAAMPDGLLKRVDAAFRPALRVRYSASRPCRLARASLSSRLTRSTTV